MEPFQSAKKKHLENVTEEHLYGHVANEMSNGLISQGLHAKAFVEADGDIQKAKVIYIKLRVAALMAEAAAHFEAENYRRVQEVALEYESRRKLLQQLIAQLAKREPLVKETTKVHICHCGYEGTFAWVPYVRICPNPNCGAREGSGAP